MSRRTHLKIKIINLADEARTIRRFERKALAHARAKAAYAIEQGVLPAIGDVDPGYNPEHHSLHSHRTGDVRWASRCSQLAYGFLRGTPYARIEQATSCDPHWNEVKKIALRFWDAPAGMHSSTGFADAWKAWHDAALDHLIAVEDAQAA